MEVFMNKIEQFKEKLKDEGRKIKWFSDNYLPDLSYTALSQQINGFTKLSDKTEAAVDKYLSECQK